MPRDLERFVRRALETLARGAPQFHERLCQTLDGRRVCVESGNERFSISFKAQGIDFEHPGLNGEVYFAANRSMILALAEGRTSLETAIQSCEIELKGSAQRVLEFHDGLMLFAGGAVRCSKFPRLLQEFRFSSAQSTDSEGYS